MTKEFYATYVNEQAKVNNSFIIILSQIKEVAKAFDNKVINKRFFDAVDKIVNKEHSAINNAYHYFGIRFYAYSNNSLLEVSANHNRFYYGTISYKLKSTCIIYSMQNLDYIQDKRLNYANFEKAVDDLAYCLDVHTQKMFGTLAKFDKYQTELQIINDRLIEIEKELAKSDAYLNTQKVYITH